MNISSAIPWLLAIQQRFAFGNNSLSRIPSHTFTTLTTFCWIAALSDPAFAKDLAIGKSYTFDPIPNYALTRDEQDSKQLTDGEYTIGRFWTSKTTVGWQETGPIKIEIDLTKPSTVSKICINTARGIHAAVSFPERVEMFLSLDHASYAYAGNLMRGQDHGDGDYSVKTFCSKVVSIDARHVWIFIHPRGPFTFVDEIRIFGADGRSSARTDYALQRENVPETDKQLSQIGTSASSLSFASHRLLATLEKWTTRGVPPTASINHIRALVSRLDNDSFADEAEIQSLEKDIRLSHTAALREKYKEPIVIWRDHPWVGFTALDTPTIQQTNLGWWTLDLLKRGTYSETINLTNASATPQTIHVAAQVDSAGHTAPSVTLLEARPIYTAGGQVRADPLVPLHSGELALNPGESKQIWLSISAQDAGPNTFPGVITFDAHTGTSWTATVPFHIRVWSAEMPLRQNVMVTNWAYLNWRPIENKQDKAVQDLVSHHTNLFALHPAHLPWPRISKDRWSIDYTEFDKVIDRYQKTDRFLFFLGFNDTRLRTLKGAAPFNTQEWEMLFTRWIADWSKHLLSRGIGYESFFFYPVDEPNSAEQEGVLYETARLIKGVNPNLQTYTTHTGAPTANISRLVPVIDIFQVLVNQLSGPFAKAVKSSKRELWSYSAGGGGKDGDPLGFYRSQAWRAFQVGATGIGFWAYADTGPIGTAWNDIDGTRPDYSVIYEGENTIITSKRWEAWREGVEDYELLVQAKQKLNNNLEQTEFWRKLDEVVEQPTNYQKLLSARRWMLDIASR
ncbi:MAG: DUF4091 domain-containing protein [Nitrospira sp.]|nr:DUF4091 domain-containing protein [Nitrospira sp.]